MSEIAVEYKRGQECANTHWPLTHSLDYGKEQADMKYTCTIDGRDRPVKTCTKCGESKSLTEFHRKSASADGHQTRCKECVRSYTKAYNATNRDRIRARDKAHYEANRDEKVRYQREYNAANRDAVNASNRSSYAKNREKAIAYSKAYHEANRETALAYKRKRYAENREAEIAKRKEYYDANRADILRQKKAYRMDRWANDPSFRARAYADRLLRKRLLSGAEREPYVREAIFIRDGWVCKLCDKPIDPDLRFPDPGVASIDHIVPVSLGGGDTPGNTQAAHLGCNLSKGNRVS